MGASLLAVGDTDAALGHLRSAVREWIHLDCLYEAARARALSAQALHAVGDEDGATLELEAAREVFVADNIFEVIEGE